jgi:disulfide bond formation protein DsbB
VTPLVRANSVALAVPAALIAGALGSQYIGGLYPCEMCHWQRWPHYAAIVAAVLAFAMPTLGRKQLVGLAALLILISGAIGAFHAGVEYHWWPGITACSQTATGSTMADILKAPIVRCDQPQWTLGTISLAGFNAIFSVGGALTVFALLMRKAR